MKEPDSKKILDAFIESCRNPALLKSRNFSYESMNQNLMAVYSILRVAKIEVKKDSTSYIVNHAQKILSEDILRGKKI